MESKQKPKKPASSHDGHRERLKERFLHNGLDSLVPHEILELLLYYGVPRKDTNPIAHELLYRFGSLSGVLDAPIEELERIPGISRHVAILIKMMPQMFRCYQVDLESGRGRIYSYQEAGEYLSKRFIGMQNEAVVLLLLDSKSRILYCGVVSVGSATASNLYIKEVVRLAARCNAVSAVLAHNHPSGECMPSKQDLETTQIVADALRSVEVYLQDHIIVGGANFLSLAESGLMTELFGELNE